MTLNIFLLGQFRLQSADQLIELPSRPAQSLMAYLVLNVGVSHRREKLASLLWPESNEADSRGHLRQALWRIRKSLTSAGLTVENYLQVSDLSISFNEGSDYWLDAGQLLLILAHVSKDSNPHCGRKPGSIPVYVACGASSL